MKYVTCIFSILNINIFWLFKICFNLEVERNECQDNAWQSNEQFEDLQLRNRDADGGVGSPKENDEQYEDSGRYNQDADDERGWTEWNGQSMEITEGDFWNKNY